MIRRDGLASVKVQASSLLSHQTKRGAELTHPERHSVRLIHYEHLAYLDLPKSNLGCGEERCHIDNV